MRRDAPTDEASLVAAARAGDRDAFGTLVSRHASSVMSVTFRMLGSAAEAEDAAQDTFVAAFKSLAGFRSGAAFSTWLYRIAINRCRDILRARRPTVQFDGEDGMGGAEPPSTLDTPYSVLEQMELAGQLDRGIDALPPLYRESFILRHIEGLDYAEMSDILGVNRDTLKMRVYKARTLLCAALAHVPGPSR